MSIRDSLIKAATRTGIAVALAHEAHRTAVRRLSPEEKWTVRIAVAEAMLKSTEAGDNDPTQHMAETLKEARLHVASNQHLVRHR